MLAGGCNHVETGQNTFNDVSRADSNRIPLSWAQSLVDEWRVKKERSDWGVKCVTGLKIAKISHDEEFPIFAARGMRDSLKQCSHVANGDAG